MKIVRMRVKAPQIEFQGRVYGRGSEIDMLDSDAEPYRAEGALVLAQSRRRKAADAGDQD